VYPAEKSPAAVPAVLRAAEAKNLRLSTPKGKSAPSEFWARGLPVSSDSTRAKSSARSSRRSAILWITRALDPGVSFDQRPSK
jgi:hypothetical protein